jgi:hypothetical protein
MTKPVFITITHDHIGKLFIKVLGQLAYVRLIAGESRAEGLLPEDVGRRIYLSRQDDLVMEPDETRRKRDTYPRIAELRDLLGVSLLYDEEDDTYAVGDPRFGPAMTPWLESEADLEEYCGQNIDALRRQAKPN